MAEKYELKEGDITKDGHTMFKDDIVADLNRKSFLENERTKNKLQGIQLPATISKRQWIATQLLQSLTINHKAETSSRGRKEGNKHLVQDALYLTDELLEQINN